MPQELLAARSISRGAASTAPWAPAPSAACGPWAWPPLMPASHQEPPPHPIRGLPAALWSPACNGRSRGSLCFTASPSSPYPFPSAAVTSLNLLSLEPKISFPAPEFHVGKLRRPLLQAWLLMALPKVLGSPLVLCEAGLAREGCRMPCSVLL